MKKKLVIVLTILLSACTNVAFDSLEYDRYITIKEVADHTTTLCGDTNINIVIGSLKTSMDHQYVYSSYRTGRPQIADASKNLKDLVDGLYTRYQSGIPSIGYCQEKLKNVSTGTTLIIKVLGGMQ
jgi:hypothetical protein